MGENKFAEKQNNIFGYKNSMSEWVYFSSHPVHGRHTQRVHQSHEYLTMIRRLLRRLEDTATAAGAAAAGLCQSNENLCPAP